MVSTDWGLTISLCVLLLSPPFLKLSEFYNSVLLKMEICFCLLFNRTSGLGKQMVLFHASIIAHLLAPFPLVAVDTPLMSCFHISASACLHHSLALSHKKKKLHYYWSRHAIEVLQQHRCGCNDMAAPMLQLMTSGWVINWLEVAGKQHCNTSVIILEYQTIFCWQQNVHLLLLFLHESNVYFLMKLTFLYG